MQYIQDSCHDGDELYAHCFQISKFNLAGTEMPMEMTPLADASARGRLEIVQALVENKAEVNSISEVSKLTRTLQGVSPFCSLLRSHVDCY